MLKGFVGSWWLLGLRGLVAIGFGAAAVLWPGATLGGVVLLFGLYALVDGVCAALAALRARRRRASWRAPLLEGMVGVGMGALALSWPAATALALLYLVAAWAIASGVFELAAAVELRRDAPGEWLLAAGGLLSVAFGVLLAVFPDAAALAVAWLVGAYAVVFGAALLALAVSVRLRARRGLLPL